MHLLDPLLALSGALIAALIGGYVTRQLKLTPIVGYVLAGAVFVRFAPWFVADRLTAEPFAEVGVILLMFGVGVRMPIQDVLAVRWVAVPGAIAQSLVATLVCGIAAEFAGWGLGAGVVYGLALSVASTVVLVRVLSDNRELDTPTGHLAVGWLVIEDLFAVLVLVLMPAIVAATSDTTVHVAMGTALVKIVAALGALLAGLVAGRSAGGVRAAAEALPMRDAFAALFFVSVGMLLDPGTLLDDPMMLAATLAVVLVGKPLTVLAIVALGRYPLTVGRSVAVALAQIGEFSFVVATVASDLGLLTSDATSTLVAAMVFSIALNPLLFRSIGVRRTYDGRPRGRPSPGNEPLRLSWSPCRRSATASSAPSR